MTTLEQPAKATPVAQNYPLGLPQFGVHRAGITKGKVLIVVDLQNDFVTGALPVPGGQDVVDSVASLFRTTDAQFVISTQDWHIEPGDHFRRWPIHGEAGTEGAELVSKIDKLPFDHRVFKGQYNSGYSAFDDTGLADWLREHRVTEVEVVGLALDFCVSATAEDAKKLGFKTTVLLDHTAATDKAGKLHTLRTFEKFGIEVI